MTDLDIQEAIATGESELGRQAWSKYLKEHYGLAEYCPDEKIDCLLLDLWAAGGWDNRPGAANPYTQPGLNSLLEKLNQS